MLHTQTFSYADLPVIAVLVLLEGLLSADNALVMAILVKHLPEKDRQKALVYGLGGALVFRGIAILAAAWIISFWWLQLIGAFYLIWITVKHFWIKVTENRDPEAPAKSLAGASFWKTVFLVEVTDIAFAIDSVLVAVSYVKSQDKVWVVYAGAIIGVVLLRFAAGGFTKLLDKYPYLEHMAYALVGWAGIKLLALSLHNYETIAEKDRLPLKLPVHVPEMSPLVFWGGMGVIMAIGVFEAVRHKNKESGPTVSPDHADD